MRGTILCLAFALGGCVSERVAPTNVDIDLANMACSGVSDFAAWQLCKFNFTQTMSTTARDFRAQSAARQQISGPNPEPVRGSAPQRVPELETDRSAAASLLLLGGTAFLNGYNQGRPATTTCLTTGMMTQCTSP